MRAEHAAQPSAASERERDISPDVNLVAISVDVHVTAMAPPSWQGLTRPSVAAPALRGVIVDQPGSPRRHEDHEGWVLIALRVKCLCVLAL
jgi:hypothetical protein